jgi:SulP family sulfate permease
MKANLLKEFTPQLFISLKTYSREKFFADLMAGVIVGIVALPLAIAFGIASGVSPEKGLFTAILAGFVISFLGGNIVQIGGPTGAFIVIVYDIIQQYGTQGLAIATFMAGLMLVLMGVLRLGSVIKFIPYPIIVGFTSGIALTIFSTQMKDLFGLTMDKAPSDFLGKWAAYAGSAGTINWWTLGVGVASLLIIIGSSKVIKKIPGSLIAIIVVTVGVYLLKNCLHIEGIETIGDRFNINNQLPGMETLPINIGTINLLFPAAFTIAILGAIESLLSAKVADGVTGARTNSNMELVAQGVANIVSPFFKGIPATGAIARTMTNINNGGRTPVAGIIHAVVLLLILLFLGDLTKHIPMACLAGVLIIVSYNMSEWRTFKALLKGPKSDVAVLLTTFILTVIFDLTIAIEIGLLLAIFLFLKRIMDNTQVSVIKDELNLSNDTEATVQEEKLALKKGIEVYEIDGPFFFGIANKFDESMRQIGERSKVRIIRMRKVPFMDSTGLHNLKNLCQKSQKEDIHIILSGVRPNVRELLQKTGFSQLLGEENICSTINIAVERANGLMESKFL